VAERMPAVRGADHRDESTLALELSGGLGSLQSPAAGEERFARRLRDGGVDCLLGVFLRPYKTEESMSTYSFPVVRSDTILPSVAPIDMHASSLISSVRWV